MDEYAVVVGKAGYWYIPTIPGRYERSSDLQTILKNIAHRVRYNEEQTIYVVKLYKDLPFNISDNIEKFGSERWLIRGGDNGTKN